MENSNDVKSTNVTALDVTLRIVRFETAVAFNVSNGIDTSEDSLVVDMDWSLKFNETDVIVAWDSLLK